MATVVYEPQDKRSELVGTGLGQGLSTMVGTAIKKKESEAQRAHEEQMLKDRFGYERDLRFDIAELQGQLQAEAQHRKQRFDLNILQKRLDSEYKNMLEEFDYDEKKTKLAFKLRVRELSNEIRMRGDEARSVERMRQEGATKRQREALGSQEYQTELQEINKQNVGKLKLEYSKNLKSAYQASNMNKIITEAAILSEQLKSGETSLDSAEANVALWNQMLQNIDPSLPTLKVNRDKKFLQIFRSETGSLKAEPSGTGGNLPISPPALGGAGESGSIEWD